jgi:RecB family endonuclease NucS
MSPTPEASERQRKAAYKAWETIRRKAAERARPQGDAAEIAEAKATAAELEEAAVAKEAKFSLERDLQAALRANIAQLEAGMGINDGGTEKIGASGGRTDILAIDANKTPVIIELKAGTADRDVIGQILQYMGDLQKKLGSQCAELLSRTTLLRAQ